MFIPVENNDNTDKYYKIISNNTKYAIDGDGSSAYGHIENNKGY